MHEKQLSFVQTFCFYSIISFLDKLQLYFFQNHRLPTVITEKNGIGLK